MPHGEHPGAGRDIVQGDLAVAVGLGRIGRVHHVDEGAHIVVDVAAYSDDARLVELDRARLLAAIQLQFEALGRREGIDVVAHLVVVGKGHVRTDRNHQHEGVKLDIVLVHHIGTGRSRRGGARRRPEGDHGIGDRLAGRGLQRNSKVRGGGGRDRYCGQ